MLHYIAWFDTRPAPRSVQRDRWKQARAQLNRVTPESWAEHAWSGAGWGVLVRQADMPQWRWTLAEQEGGLTTLSIGLPVGLDARSPTELGRRLLDGENVHADVAAPFALLTVDDRAGILGVQQDWHGMGQVFRLEHDGTVAFSNRPTSLPPTLGAPTKPHLRGWSYYLGTGNFAANSSPVRGVELLSPGERVTGRRDPNGAWTTATEIRRDIDILITEALNEQVSFEEIVERTAAGVRRAARSLARLYTGTLTMGLSGGKDSRLIASAVLSEGIVPVFRTNEDNPREGETARELVRILRESRGIDARHEFYLATDTSQLADLRLRERARLLQLRNDFMFPSAYLNRAPEGQPAAFGPPSMTGLMGEYVSDIWVPEPWRQDPGAVTYDDVAAQVAIRFGGKVPDGALRRPTRRRDHELVTSLLEHAQGLGLSPFGTLAYAYIMKIRRQSSAQTHLDQVQPLALPETVKASVQLTGQQKSERALHTATIAALMPEWAGVGFVRNNSGVAQEDFYRVWHDSGAEDLEALLDAPEGAVTSLMNREPVRAALGRGRAGLAKGPADVLLRQFTMAAVADEYFASDQRVPSGSLLQRVLSRS